MFLKEDNSDDYSHAEKLHVFINDVLEETKVKKSQLNAIAVSKGPGSYTGLRIGVSTAKGLCYALDLPLIAVSTLEHLAHQIETKQGTIIPLLDARRMEVYTAAFNQDYKTVSAIEAKVVDEKSFLEHLRLGKVFFLGNGVAKVKHIINHDHAVFVEHKLPSANEMSALAYQRYQKNHFEDVAYFEPYYLKDFMVLSKKV